MASIFRQGATLALLISGSAQAAGWQNLDAVDAAVVAALGDDGAEARTVDRRLKLAACPERVAVDPPGGGAVVVRCASLGWRIRVPILVGTARVASEPIVIRRGDPVSVVTGSGGFSVTVSGIADEDGRAGDRLRVRTRPSAPAIMGQIVDEGTVRLR